uniref:Putative methyltransferase n=1 Tax=viral metagenome TaxID=1070528 RepID=A0A6M3LEC6_9ZZZZ
MINVPMIEIDKIIIPERARVELGESYDKLKISIEKRGQITPIIINKKDNELVDGFRRLTALKELSIIHAKVAYEEDLTPIEKKLMELEANIHEPLTWDEKAKLRDQIHKIYVEMHGKAVRGHDSEGWGIKETAEIMGVSQAVISQDLNLVEVMTDVPGLKKMKSRRQALKMVDRFKEIAILTEIAKRESKKQSSGFPYILKHGDASEIVKTDIEEETIDLVIYDPPWGIDVDRIASSRGPRGEKTTFDDSEDAALNLNNALLPELYRVMKADAHMYMFIGIQFKDLYTDLLTNYETLIHRVNIMLDWFPQMKLQLLEMKKRALDLQKTRLWSFHVEPVPLIWVKEGGGYTDFDYKFMPRYETILFCSKGIKKRLNEVSSNIFEFNRPATTERIHTQEKPVDLIQRLIRLSSQPNEIILDPCAGSFVTAIAATITDRRSISIEKEREAYIKGVQRIAALTVGLEDEEELEDEEVSEDDNEQTDDN